MRRHVLTVDLRDDPLVVVPGPRQRLKPLSCYILDRNLARPGRLLDVVMGIDAPPEADVAPPSDTPPSPSAPSSTPTAAPSPAGA